MELDNGMEPVRGLRRYLELVGSTVGVNEDLVVWTGDVPAAAYIPLDGLWDEESGWAAAIETDTGYDLIEVSYLDGDVLPPPGEVKRFVAALLAGGWPGRPDRVVLRSAGDDGLRTRLADYAGSRGVSAGITPLGQTRRTPGGALPGNGRLPGIPACCAADTACMESVIRPATRLRIRSSRHVAFIQHRTRRSDFRGLRVSNGMPGRPADHDGPSHPDTPAAERRDDREDQTGYHDHRGTRSGDGGDRGLPAMGLRDHSRRGDRA